MNTMFVKNFASLPKPSTNEDASILLKVQNSMAGLRLGLPLLVQDRDMHHLVLAVDGLTNDNLLLFRSMQFGRSPMLVLSGERSTAIGLGDTGIIALPTVPTDTAKSLISIATAHPTNLIRRPIHHEARAGSVLDLLTKMKFLPACLWFGDVNNANNLLSQGVPMIDSATIGTFDDAKVNTLRRKSDAPIPIRGGIDTHMVVFEYATGDNEIALLVGSPGLKDPLPIRIHSACATGDIFGSEKCDCGDQLRLAIEKLHALGGGAVLYLHQEGRGIGLTNKIRAYNLQNQSLDTVDANRTLGFQDDLRDYKVAANMTRVLGWRDVCLLTNNPRKIAALRENGLTVVKRMAHLAPINEHNKDYLKTKAERSGHLLDYN